MINSITFSLTNEWVKSSSLTHWWKKHVITLESNNSPCFNFHKSTRYLIFDAVHFQIGQKNKHRSVARRGPYNIHTIAPIQLSMTVCLLGSPIPIHPFVFFPEADEEEKLTFKVVALAWMNARNKRMPRCTRRKGREGTMRPRGVWRVLYRELLQWETASAGGYSVFSVLIESRSFYVRSSTCSLMVMRVTMIVFVNIYGICFL